MNPYQLALCVPGKEIQNQAKVPDFVQKVEIGSVSASDIDLARCSPVNEDMWGTTEDRTSS